MTEITDVYKARHEREFLRDCLALGEHGRLYLQQLTSEHFTTDATRSAYEWLVNHYRDPLGQLPDDPGRLLQAVVEGMNLYNGEDLWATLVVEAVAGSRLIGPVTYEGLGMRLVELDLHLASRKLAVAQKAGDADRMRELRRELAELRSRLHRPQELHC